MRKGQISLGAGVVAPGLTVLAIILDVLTLGMVISKLGENFARRG